MTLADNLAGVQVHVGFGVNAAGGSFFILDDPVKGKLDDATYLLAPATVFVDITSHVSAVTTDRGRERELDGYKTGTATIEFNDNDRTFDPSYTGSPYAGEIVPMKRVIVGWQGARIYTGWVDDWAVTYEPGDTLSRVTATCVDAFSILANQQLTTTPPDSQIAVGGSFIVLDHAVKGKLDNPTFLLAHDTVLVDVVQDLFVGDYTGERIARVLARPEVNFPASRSIALGNSVLGVTTFGENALSYIQECARAEAGYLYVSTGGALTFRDRLATLNMPSNAVFSDDPTAGIPYRTVTQRSSTDLLFTRVTGQSETTGDEAVAASPTTTNDDFFIRTLDLGSLMLLTNVDTQNLVDYYLQRFSAVETRFDTATINVGALSTAEVFTLISLDLIDLVTVQRSPLSVGTVIERLSLVDGISHRIGHGTWSVDLSFSNADARLFLELDDATLGVLGSNRLAF